MAAHDTRQRILNAALILFSEKGFIGATTREIADEAKVAEVTLFRHFESKDNLFEETLKGYSFLPELERLLNKVNDMPYEEGIYVVAYEFFDALKRRKDIIRIIQSEMYRYPEKLHNAYHEMVDEIIKAFAGYFKELQDVGVLRSFDPIHAARAFMGLIFSFFNMQELLLRSIYRKDDERMIIASFINIFARGTMR